MGVLDVLAHAFSVFKSTPGESADVVDFDGAVYFPISAARPSRYFGGARSNIVDTIINRIAVEVAAVPFRQVVVDDSERLVRIPDTGLNQCLVYSPNLDQTPRSFMHDAAASLMHNGAIAIVPVETDTQLNDSGAYDILSLRVGEIVAWKSDTVKVRLYDERDGRKKEVKLSKRSCVIVENPHYAVMNQPNSTLSRLTEKLRLLDHMDNSTLSGKLDLILQLPYVVRGETKNEQARRRLQDLESQLADSKYGIAYVDGTERITQLNRPVENNLLEQIDRLTNELYDRLGMPKEIFSGTASEAITTNFYHMTVEPILDALSQAMTKTFLTKTARTQGHRVRYVRDPFRAIPVSALASTLDMLVRNEIVTSNEVRDLIGLRPSTDPAADELRNANINPKGTGSPPAPVEPTEEEADAE